MKSKKWELNSADWSKIGKNTIKFVAPTLAIFFSLLSQGVSIEKAWPVALLALWQSSADIFGKLSSGK